MNYEPHPLSNVYREMTPSEYAALLADVQANGVRVAGWLYEGKILDGRHRYRAALEAGKPCLMQNYNGDDPVGFARSLNEARRHLEFGVRALAAAASVTAESGKSASSQTSAVTAKKAAEAHQVSVRSVQAAKKVLAQGSPELVEAVKAGEIGVEAAAAVVDEPDPVVAAKEPKPKKADVAVLQARIAELEGKVEDLEQQLDEVRSLLQDEMTANLCFQADEPLKAALEKIRETEEACANRVRIAESAMNGLMNERNAAIRQVKAMQRKGK